MAEKPHPFETYKDRRNDEAAAIELVKRGREATSRPSDDVTEQQVKDAARATGRVPSPGIIGRGPGNVAKGSPSGEFIGWYRNGQRAGMPAKAMPLESELLELEHQYKAEVGRLYFALGKRDAGRASGEARQELKQVIRQLADELRRKGCTKRGLVQRIFAELSRQGVAVKVRHIQDTLAEKIKRTEQSG